MSFLKSLATVLFGATTIVYIVGAIIEAVGDAIIAMNPERLPPARYAFVDAVLASVPSASSNRSKLAAGLLSQPAIGLAWPLFFGSYRAIRSRPNNIQYFSKFLLRPRAFQPVVVGLLVVVAMAILR